MGAFFSLLFLIFATLPSASASINPNTANASELAQFKGVGPKTADSIISYREANGPFVSCDDLVKVRGIGSKKLEQIKPDCAVDGKPSKAGKSQDTKKKSAQPASNPNGIDINSASASELTKLNGVGPSTAAKIISYRDANGPFAACDDLRKVKGIGAKTLDKIKPDCTVSKK